MRFKLIEGNDFKPIDGIHIDFMFYSTALRSKSVFMEKLPHRSYGHEAAEYQHCIAYNHPRNTKLMLERRGVTAFLIQLTSEFRTLLVYCSGGIQMSFSRFDISNLARIPKIRLIESSKQDSINRIFQPASNLRFDMKIRYLKRLL